MEGMPFRTVCTGCHGELGRGFVPFCPGCGAMSDVAYDLAAVELRDSADPYVRFHDLLPVHDPELLPGDARFTPTVHATALGEAIGLPWLYLKDETNFGADRAAGLGVQLATVRDVGRLRAGSLLAGACPERSSSPVGEKKGVETPRRQSARKRLAIDRRAEGL